MPEIGFIRPNYPHEKRVSILPRDIISFRRHIEYEQIIVETGFGASMNINDQEYLEAGCLIASRAEVFSMPVIYSLKLIQPADYDLLKKNQKIIGWMHPKGSGYEFYNSIAASKNIIIFDIDSIYPRVYLPNGKNYDVGSLPRHFFWKNSYIAGIASTRLGLDVTKFKCGANTQVAVLGSGSVAQGAFNELSTRGMRPRMFNRKTLDIFYKEISSFDLIVNGIEVDVDNLHVMDRVCIEKTKNDVLIIDAAADAGRAIEGTNYLSIDAPVGITYGRAYTLVNNAPTLLFEEASHVISEVSARFLLGVKF